MNINKKLHVECDFVGIEDMIKKHNKYDKTEAFEV